MSINDEIRLANMKRYEHFSKLTTRQRRSREKRFLKKLKTDLPKLKQLLKRIKGHWYYEDGFYRFYHGSFKLYRIQSTTLEIVEAFKVLLPGEELDATFIAIIKRGTGLEFTLSHNDNWLEISSPILEAFSHAKYFLEMLVKYGQELDEFPQMMPSGWAAICTLYCIMR